MNHKELLELAAKAAGYDFRFSYYWYDNEEPQILVEDPFGKYYAAWNPLTDDGDALRLAVKIGMLIDARYTEPEALKHNRVMFWIDPSCASEILGEYCEDIYSSTRLAITRAAAEIGRAMK